MSEANQGLDGIVRERKSEAFKLKDDMEDLVLSQTNRNFEVQVDLGRIENQELPRVRKEKEDLEEDIGRMNELC